MGSHLNEDPNYGSSKGFPLMGPELKAVQGGFPPTHGSYPPPQNYSARQVNSATGPPITTQPMGEGCIPNSGWMSMPQTVPYCPPGLEYLFMIDQLIVNREPNLKDTVVGWVSKNTYVITNCRKEKVYYAAEVSESCSRNWCSSNREFEMNILDNFGHEVISMNRPLACQHCCCPCCLQSIEISSPPGCMVGVIEQQWSIFYPSFVIKNSVADIVLRIKGPFCGPACCADVNFMILSADGSTELGKVYNKFLGCGNQTYTDANVFGIKFPMDLDLKMKAVMLGACFLIEMMYFAIPGNMRTTPRIPTAVLRHE